MTPRLAIPHPIRRYRELRRGLAGVVEAAAAMARIRGYTEAATGFYAPHVSDSQFADILISIIQLGVISQADIDMLLLKGEAAATAATAGRAE